nr:MAG TPA: hypothetical protein [Caudoviricetes sp.]
MCTEHYRLALLSVFAISSRGYTILFYCEFGPPRLVTITEKYRMFRLLFPKELIQRF